jgi:hypothetical protein
VPAFDFWRDAVTAAEAQGKKRGCCVALLALIVTATLLASTGARMVLAVL